MFIYTQVHSIIQVSRVMCAKYSVPCERISDRSSLYKVLCAK